MQMLKMSSYRMPNVQMSKWQWALLAGAPLILGAGYYVYKKQKSSSDVDGNKPKSKSSKDKLKGTATIALDSNNSQGNKHKNTVAESEPLTPLKEANLFKNEGNTAYRNGKYDEAIHYYNQAIAKCPEENRTDMAIFYQNRAAAYEMLKMWDNVKKDCSQSLEYNPRYAKAYFRRAKAHEACNDLLECLNDITACCILEMFQNDNSIALADRVLKQTGRQDAELGIQKRVPTLPSNNFIRTYLRSFVNDPVQKIVLPEAVLAEAPRGFARAKLAMEQEQFDEVIPACTEEIASSEAESSYKSEALLLRGTFHLLAGNFAQSLQDLTAVINNTDADDFLRSHALIKRASLNIQVEQKDGGLQDFITAEQLSENNADIYHQRAQIYILLDRLYEALQEFDKVLKLVPKHAMAYVQKCYADYRLALMSQDRARLILAVNEFHGAIEKFPDCVECYSLLAQVLSDQQEFAQSDLYYEKAIKMAPYNAPLYVHRAIMLLQWKGDIEQAVSLMQRALEVDDKCELAYETLGTVEVQRANLSKAIELFEKAIPLAKSQAEMCHLYSLRNAAVAQMNVTQKLGIDMQALQALTQSNLKAQAAQMQ